MQIGEVLCMSLRARYDSPTTAGASRTYRRTRCSWSAILVGPSALHHWFGMIRKKGRRRPVRWGVVWQGCRSLVPRSLLCQDPLVSRSPLCKDPLDVVWQLWLVPRCILWRDRLWQGCRSLVPRSLLCRDPLVSRSPLCKDPLDVVWQSWLVPRCNLRRDRFGVVWKMWQDCRRLCKDPLDVVWHVVVVFAICAGVVVVSPGFVSVVSCWGPVPAVSSAVVSCAVMPLWCLC
jgi:hypothetical protein